MAQLLNRADVSGTFDGVLIDNYTELTVELSALDITKRADKSIWVKDELTYTIEVTDIDVRDPDDPDYPGLPVTGVVVTDTIDPLIATLVDGSVMIDGTPATTPDQYTFDATTGLLTVTLGTVEVGAPREITFRTRLLP